MKAPTPQPDSPEDILTQFDVNMSAAYAVEDSPNGGRESSHRMIMEARAEALAKLDEYYTNKVLELLGEDEPEDGDDYPFEYGKQYGKNELRAELRTAIKNLNNQERTEV